jgi:hypothetical protein
MDIREEFDKKFIEAKEHLAKTTVSTMEEYFDNDIKPTEYIKELMVLITAFTCVEAIINGGMTAEQMIYDMEDAIGEDIWKKQSLNPYIAYTLWVESDLNDMFKDK